jgi:2-epi-5-epi-valiolone synthase
VAAHWRALLQSRFQAPERIVHRILYLSAKRMLDELQPNLYEDQTYRRLVDAGHTFSPPLEAASGFSLHHGEAVAIDLALSATLAHLMGRLARDHRDRIIETIAAVGLPVHHAALDFALCSSALDDAERHRAGAVNLVVPVRIGSGAFLERRSDVDEAALREALRLLAREQARRLGRWTGVTAAPAAERVS